AGRGDLVAGLEELVVRWAGTDGLVGLVESELPAGVTGHRLSDIDHATPLAAIDLTGVVGAPPATVVHVAIDGPDVLPPAADDHTVDLPPAGLAPEAFAMTVPADPSGAWAVRLGRRAACRTTGSTDDPDGVLGQAGRLTTVLRPLAAAGPVLVVAHGGAGRRRAPARATRSLAG